MDTRELPKGWTPILRDVRDLEDLVVPDFFTAGFMPKVIQEYLNIKQDLKGRLEIGIRKFIQGPFQLATNLLGKERVYETKKIDPLFIQKLMDFQVTMHYEWIKGWEKLHGREYCMVNIGEETLDTASKIAPEVFREIILPYHVRYGDEYRQVHWHSCADVNAIMDQLIEIPNLTVVEIGLFTDTLTSEKSFAGTNVQFYKIPNPKTEL